MSRKIEASLRSKHQQFEESYGLVRSEAQELLKETCEERGWIFLDRLKELPSFALKVLDGRFSDYIIDDFYACMIVVPNLVAIEPACSLIRSILRVQTEKPGVETKSRPTEFNFDSIRFYCQLPESVKPKSHGDLSFEIQVKTLLEHAWSKATHDFSYKGTDVSWAKERLSAQIKAILDNADLSILEMERLSASGFLAKQNPEYVKLKRIVEYLKGEFEADPETPIQEDYKRIATHVDKLLTRFRLSVDDLEKCMSDESDHGRGSKMQNFSIYSVVLLSLIKQFPDKILRSLTNKKSRDKRQRIVIPKEVLSEWGNDGSSFKNVVLLA